jgi:hypothetical protein
MVQQTVLRTRCLVTAALLTFVSLSVGCQPENYSAPLSSRDCVKGWNAGTIQWLRGGPLEPTSSVDLAGHRVWVSADETNCQLAVDLGRDRVQVFGSPNRTPDPEDTENGLTWTIDPRLGISTGAEFGMQSSADFAVTSPSGWNACGAIGNRVLLGSDCGNIAPNPPTSIVEHDLAAVHQGVRELPTGTGWWLGDRYDGVTPKGMTPLMVGWTGTWVGYSVHVNSDRWLVNVITVRRRPVSSPCDGFERSILCPNGSPVGSIVAVLHPKPRVTVSIVSTYQPQTPGAYVSPTPGRPLPAALQHDIVAHVTAMTR